MTTGSFSNGGRALHRAAKVFASAVVIGTVFGVASSPASAQKGGGTTPPPPDVVYRYGDSLYTMNLNGVTPSNKVRILRRFGADYPCFSPDRTKIAFEAYRNGAYGVYVSDYTGANPVQIASVAGSFSCPKWSPNPAPDGQYKILFTDGADLHCVNPDGTERQRLTFSRNVWSGGDWSASSTRIVAVTGHDDPNPTGMENHYLAFDVVNDGNGGVAGANHTDLTLTYGILPNTRHNGPPAFLNGSETDFAVTPMGEESGPSDLWRVSYDGLSASATYLGFPASYRGWWPSLTPANDRIVYASGQNIYVIGASGGGSATWIAAGTSPNHRRF